MKRSRRKTSKRKSISKSTSRKRKAFYVLGLCSCDTIEQRDQIEEVVTAMQKKRLLPNTKYYIHMVNISDKKDLKELRTKLKNATDPKRQKLLQMFISNKKKYPCSTSEHVFSRKFLTEFGVEPLNDKMLKYKYSLIFNHYCPMNRAPFTTEGIESLNKIRTKHSYMVTPEYDEEFIDRWNLNERLFNPLELIGRYEMNKEDDETFSIYQFLD